MLGLVCAPYLLFAIDTSTALARRARAGESIFQAHRSHTYQRLANDLGLPHWVVSACVAVLSALVTWAITIGAVAGLITAALATVTYLSAPRLVGRRMTL